MPDAKPMPDRGNQRGSALLGLMLTVVIGVGVVAGLGRTCTNRPPTQSPRSPRRCLVRSTRPRARCPTPA